MSETAFRNYLSLEKNYSDHTVRAYLRDLEAFAAYLEDAHGELNLQEVPYTLIRSWVIRLMEEGISNRSINRKISSLKAYYNYLQRKGKIEANPLAGHKPLKTARKVEVPFSKEEMQRLFDQWPVDAEFEDLRDRLVVELLYTTGMRRAELIGLEVSDADLPSKTLRVTGKRNKQRILPLLPGVALRLERYIRAREQEFPGLEHPYLFLTSAGNKLYETLVYRIINGYLSKVSAKAKRSPHILRHTFATHMLNQGADMNSVKELLGHSSLASTQVYTHNSIAELKRIHGDAHPRNRDQNKE